jgi:hypothetical protein
MASRRRIRSEEDVRVSDYRSHIAGVVDEGIRAAMDKDAHLVELSLLRHFPIASQDDKQRRYVMQVSGAYPLVEKVQWFNPISSPDWEDWIKSGCADEEIYRCVCPA